MQKASIPPWRPAAEKRAGHVTPPVFLTTRTELTWLPLLKRCCSTSPAMNPTDGSRRIGLRSLYQAQSRLNAIRMGSAFPCPSRYHGISEGHERYVQVHRPPVRFGLPLGMEQSKRDRGRGT